MERLSSEVLKDWLYELPRMDSIVSNNKQLPIAFRLSHSTILTVLKDVIEEVLEYREAAQQNVQMDATKVCPECDSTILETGYCMMGHWCGDPHT